MNCTLGNACTVTIPLSFTDADHWAIEIFICLGIFYYIISIVDKIRWWNGSDENGNPK